MTLCFSSSGLVLLRNQCCDNCSTFLDDIFQWLGASLNAKTLAGATDFIFLASVVFDAQTNDKRATKKVSCIYVSL